jgi:hypothetical protein
MVIEYRGETVRECIANRREHEYNITKHDCFLLKMDEDHVTDSTFQGNQSRFTNHSCCPNMYSIIVEADNRLHVRPPIHTPLTLPVSVAAARSRAGGRSQLYNNTRDTRV